MRRIGCLFLVGMGFLPPASAWTQVQGQILSPDATESGSISDEEFRLPIDPTAAASADELIRKLGSPVYKEREAATDGLIEIGAPALARLRSAYQTTDDLEVRLRIERIVRTAYLNHHVYNRSGFLGINLQPYSASMEEHPRLPKDAVGVKVGKVIPGTAAERAGLTVDDVIFEVDGDPVRGEGMQVVETFSATIRDRGPGGRMKLTVLRGMQRIP
ncbi:MAG: PDZ domain-containing protein, partial [Phycisphaerales bacterium]|nr:PDZ domain-containing protein [Phycisphaerales bacterium]